MNAVMVPTRVPQFAARTWRAGAGVLAVVALLAIWQLLAAPRTGFSPVPTPTAIIEQMSRDGAVFYLRAIAATGTSAALGWLWGNVAAIIAVLLISVFAVTRGPVLRAAVAVYCLPIVAVGPILAVLFGGNIPQIMLAALSVYFPTVVATDAAMHTFGGSVRYLVPAFGGGRVAELVKVRLRFGLPGLFAGLRIAAPSALLGALIGEYLGAETGLGVAMVAAQQSLQVERTWALAAVGTLVAGLAYLAVSIFGRLATGWTRDATPAAAQVPATVSPFAAAHLGRALVSAASTLVLLLICWQLLLWLFRVDTFIGWGPFAVADYLLGSEDAAAHRAVIWQASLPTFAHAAVGLGSGLASAVLVAIAFVLLPPVRLALLPLAMALRSVPLVALTPLIALVFGRGLAGVAVATGIVTFFPTLTMLTQALEDTPISLMRLGAAYGAGRTRILLLIRLVHALPTLFAALRTSAPLAITGALLAEWLFTGDGLGHVMLISQHAFRIGELWSAVVAVTGYSLVLYGFVNLLEQLVRRVHAGTLAFGRGRARRRSISGVNH